MANQIPSINWARRVSALTGSEDLLKQNPVSDSSPQEERIPVNLVKDFIFTRIGLELPITSLRYIPNSPTNNSILRHVSGGTSYIWDTAYNLFLGNLTLTNNRLHNLGAFSFRFNTSTGGSFGVGDFNGDENGSVFEYDEADEEVTLYNTDLIFKTDFADDTEKASIKVNGDDLDIEVESGDLNIILPTGSVINSGYNTNKTAANLGKTESGYMFVMADDGSFIVKDITTLPSGGGGSANIEYYSGGTRVFVYATGSGVTASLASGVLTINIPNGVDLINGEVEYTAAEAVYSAVGVAAGSFKIRIVYANGTTHYTKTPVVMGRTAVGVINNGNPLTVSSAANNDWRIDERSGGAVGYVFQALGSRTAAGGFIYF